MGEMTPEERAISAFLSEEKIEFYRAAEVSSLPVIREHLLPEGAKCVVVFLIPYYVECTDENRNISRYAVSRDYHLYAKSLSDKISALFSGIGSKHFAYVKCDSSPIDEVSAATSLMLGVRGKNSLLINSKYGSYVFIGGIYTSCDLPLLLLPTHIDENAKSGICKTCGACISACPTKLSGRGECLSALTQKKKLTPEEAKAVADSPLAWGCDTCQEVCPHNSDIPETPISFFYEERVERLSPEILSSMSDASFSERAFSWRGRAVAERQFTPKL